MTGIFLAYQYSHRIYPKSSQRLQRLSSRFFHKSRCENDDSDKNAAYKKPITHSGKKAGGAGGGGDAQTKGESATGD